DRDRRPAALAADRALPQRARPPAPPRAHRLGLAARPGLDRDVAADADPRRGPRRAARLDGAVRALRDARLRVLAARGRPVPHLRGVGGELSRRYRFRATWAPGPLGGRVAAGPRAARVGLPERALHGAARRVHRRLVRRARDRPDAERNARPDGVLLALPGTNLRVPGSTHRPLPGPRKRQRLPVRGGMTMSTAVAHGAPQHHPIGLVVTDDLQRSRLTTFFRPLLAIPHLVLVALWALAALFAFVIAWFAALVTGRVPLALHSFMSDWLRYATRVEGYLCLLAEPFPHFGSGGEYPFDARIDVGEEQSRLTVFFRW